MTENTLWDEISRIVATPMPRRRAVKLMSSALFAAFAGVRRPPRAYAAPATCLFGGSGRRIVCCQNTNDRLSLAEGYERARGGGIFPTDNNPSLTNCLAAVQDGDELVIIAHGFNEGEGFTWQGEEYTDFGDGEKRMPLPPGFKDRRDVCIRFTTCWSSRDPDGRDQPDKSLAEKLIAAMGGKANGNVVSPRFIDLAHGDVTYRVAGSVDERKAANEALAKNGQPWLNNAPVNRPGATVTHLTAAQAIVKGKVTVILPNAVGSRDTGWPGTDGYVPGTPGYVKPRNKRETPNPAGPLGPHSDDGCASGDGHCVPGHECIGHVCRHGCGPHPCFNQGRCSPNDPTCTCIQRKAGPGRPLICFCHQGSSCSDLPPCERGDDCPKGWACALSCCSYDESDFYCHPPCGEHAGQGQQPLSGQTSVGYIGT